MRQGKRLIGEKSISAELADAARWYELQRKGLGNDFLMSVNSALQLVESLPTKYSVVFQNIRRIVVRRFSYGIYYVIKSTTIIVIAIHHYRRHPDSRQKRSASIEIAEEK